MTREFKLMEEVKTSKFPYHGYILETDSTPSSNKSDDPILGPNQIIHTVLLEACRRCGNKRRNHSTSEHHTEEFVHRNHLDGQVKNNAISH
ncbi:hypothetical protein MTR_2g103773 [Medicago truncatula]|uniref:Uncharacterized protein n=1 Tax=Medicago truncatula TaxID=3880 RepID=A0A072VDT1_MEDTR|nr:hypothetical protein MTR_2g103773 [Medicago truncatula]